MQDMLEKPLRSGDIIRVLTTWTPAKAYTHIKDYDEHPLFYCKDSIDPVCRLFDSPEPEDGDHIQLARPPKRREIRQSVEGQNGRRGSKESSDIDSDMDFDDEDEDEDMSGSDGYEEDSEEDEGTDEEEDGEVEERQPELRRETESVQGNDAQRQHNTQVTKVQKQDLGGTGTWMAPPARSVLQQPTNPPHQQPMTTAPTMDGGLSTSYSPNRQNQPENFRYAQQQATEPTYQNSYAGNGISVLSENNSLFTQMSSGGPSFMNPPGNNFSPRSSTAGYSGMNAFPYSLETPGGNLTTKMAGSIESTVGMPFGYQDMSSFDYKYFDQDSQGQNHNGY